MKFIYFVQEYNFKGGVGKKIINQTESLLKLGYNVKILSINNFELENNNKSNCIEHIKVETFGINNNLLITILRHYKIYATLRYLNNNLGSNDILYVRSLPPNPLYVFGLEKKRRKCNVISEFQTIECFEKKIECPLNIYCVFDFFFRKSYNRCFDAIVGVTEEITKYHWNRANDLKIPFFCIGNGFDVNSVSLRHIPDYPNGEFHILCVANINRWHGLDRLLQGLATYTGTTRVVFHIAGNGSELPHLQKLTNELGIADQVVFHGFLTGNALDALFEQCHIAVGSLGIHRIGLKEASILKAREYCARGIPFIYGISDPDFPEDFPYILHLPADESPIDIEKVLAFTKEVCVDPDHPQKMRQYAKEHLDWSVKMNKLKDFLETLTENDSL